MTKYEEYTEKVNAMPERTEAQKARKTKALELLERVDRFSGAYGCIEELLSTPSRSQKRDVGKQGENDNYVRVLRNGKVTTYIGENKTNGGRIEDLITGKNKSKYVLYAMDVCNAGTSHKRRKIDRVVFSTARFLELLEECNAIKSTNGSHPERAIQVTSKAFYNALLTEGIPHNPEKVYNYEDLND